MLSLRRYDWIFHLATIAICAYLIARAGTTYIAGVLESVSGTANVGHIVGLGGDKRSEEKGEILTGLEDFQVIIERNVFNAADTGAAKTGEGEEGNIQQQGGELGPAVKTSLDIKVLGVLVVGEGTDRRSSATVLGGKDSKGAIVYYVGDDKALGSNAKLIKVAKDRIEFLNGGRLEYAEMEDFAAKKSIFAKAEDVFGKNSALGGDKENPEGKSVEGGKIVVDQKEVDDALQNLDKLYNEIRIVPNFKDGRAAGMKVLSVKPGSIVGKLGIRRGDVLEKVNGRELDIKSGMDLFNQMKDMKSFSVDVERGGKNQTLEYEIR